MSPEPTSDAPSKADVQRMQEAWRELLPESTAAEEVSLDPLDIDEAEWRQRLGDDAFRVLRKEGTERAFSHELNDEKRRGVFVCAGCELPLFTSDMKFDSGTGWPSFFTTIPGHTGTKRDFKLLVPRIEYHCIRCGGHQGHVFPDGPAPTGQRYCNNGVALRFLPSDG